MAILANFILFHNPLCPAFRTLHAVSCNLYTRHDMTRNYCNISFPPYSVSGASIQRVARHLQQMHGAFAMSVVLAGGSDASDALSRTRPDGPFQPWDTGNPGEPERPGFRALRALRAFDVLLMSLC